MRKRVLLTDVVFPNKYAKWRLLEIKAFMENYDTDVLNIYRVDNFADIEFKVDYEELCEEYNLQNYDILIFNPKYNYLNKYNKDIDGTVYNNTYYGNYLFRLKKFRHGNFVLDYYCVYHIFMICAQVFNDRYKFPQNKQYIHLYPGGNGYSPISKYPQMNVIATQYFITEFLNTRPNRYINVYGAPYLEKNAVMKPRVLKSDQLSVCFTSLGQSYHKGSDIYVKIAAEYKIKYPAHNIIFYGIGNVEQSQYITNMPPMSQKDLDIFYQDIDIIFNLERGKTDNGWPLGAEAVFQGAILLTVDNNNMNYKNGYNIDKFHIIDSNNINEIVDKIQKLYEDRGILAQYSNILQKRFYELFSYKDTMSKIFNFIKERNSTD